MTTILNTIKESGSAFCPLSQKDELFALAKSEGIILNGGIAFTADDPRNPIPGTACQCYYK